MIAEVSILRIIAVQEGIFRKIGAKEQTETQNKFITKSCWILEVIVNDQCLIKR